MGNGGAEVCSTLLQFTKGRKPGILRGRHIVQGGIMKRGMLVGLLTGWVSMAAAEPLPPWQNALPEQTDRLGQVLDTASGEWLDAEQLVQRLAPVDHVLVGEQHDNEDHHRLQLWLLQRLHQQRPQASLLLEMLTPSQQSAVDELQQSGRVVPAEQLPERLQWNPGWDWSMYGPIVSWALETELRLGAANLDRADISESYSNPPPVSPRYTESALAELQHTIEASHCGQIAEPQLSAMRGIQQQRDVRMAEALATAAVPSMMLAGNFHVRKDVGVPLHLDGPAPVVVMLHEAGKPLPGPEQTDYLWLTPAAPEKDHCAQWK